VRGRRPYAPGVPLSQSYVCFRCGKPGHFIRNCPTNGVSAGKLTLQLYKSECEILQGSVFSPWYLLSDPEGCFENHWFSLKCGKEITFALVLQYYFNQLV